MISISLERSNGMNFEQARARNRQATAALAGRNRAKEQAGTTTPGRDASNENLARVRRGGGVRARAPRSARRRGAPVCFTGHWASAGTFLESSSTTLSTLLRGMVNASDLSLPTANVRVSDVQSSRPGRSSQLFKPHAQRFGYFGALQNHFWRKVHNISLANSTCPLDLRQD